MQIFLFNIFFQLREFILCVNKLNTNTKEKEEKISVFFQAMSYQKCTFLPKELLKMPALF